MTLSEFTLKLLFLFFPGIIAYLIIQNLTNPSKKSDFYFILYAFVFGVFSYLITYFFAPLLHIDFNFIGCLFDKNCSIDTANITKTIAITTGFAILLGFVFSYLININLLFKICSFIKITNKSGNGDVWEEIYFKRNKTWVRIIDFEQDLVYEGWISRFSTGFKENEILLKEVKIYKNSTREPVYQEEEGKYDLDALYITRKQDNLTIEFPILKGDNND